MVQVQPPQQHKATNSSNFRKSH